MYQSLTPVGLLYEREYSDIGYPIYIQYMEQTRQLFFIDETRHKLVQIWLPFKYELLLAINYSDLRIVLDWSPTYAEYARRSSLGFPTIKINGVIMDNKYNNWPIIDYTDAVCDIFATQQCYTHAPLEKTPLAQDTPIIADDVLHTVIDVGNINPTANNPPKSLWSRVKKWSWPRGYYGETESGAKYNFSFA